MEQADVVYWIGPNLETFLGKALHNRGNRQNVTLAEAPGVVHLPSRAGGVWADEHAHESHADHEHGVGDPHVWLDPRNAAAMVEKIVEILAAIDPQQAARYRENGRWLQSRLSQLESELSTLLAPVRDRPYIVFHDAYRYFEQRFGLASAGAVSLGPERMPSARRIQELRKHIEAIGAQCVFREPQFESRLVDILREDLAMRVGVLDPLGGGLPPGPDQYFELLRGNAHSLRDCLDQTQAGAAKR